MINSRISGKILDFDELTINSEHWFRQAIQLLEAADILHLDMVQLKRPTTATEVNRRAGCAKGAALLMGLAIENALKGFATAHGKLYINSGSQKSSVKGWGYHNLIEIATDLGLDLCAEERGLIQRMTIPTMWASKYQTPKRRTSFDIGNSYVAILDSDSRMTRVLIEHLMSSSGFEPVNGWST